MSKYLFLKCRLISKKLSPYLKLFGPYLNYQKLGLPKLPKIKKIRAPPKLPKIRAFKKIDILGPHFGGFLAESPQKIFGDKTAFAAQQLYTKIRF